MYIVPCTFTDYSTHKLKVVKIFIFIYYLFCSPIISQFSHGHSVETWDYRHDVTVGICCGSFNALLSYTPSDGFIRTFYWFFCVFGHRRSRGFRYSRSFGSLEGFDDFPNMNIFQGVVYMWSRFGLLILLLALVGLNNCLVRFPGSKNSLIWFLFSLENWEWFFILHFSSMWFITAFWFCTK